MTTATAAVTATRRPPAGWIRAAGGPIGVASGRVTAFATFGRLDPGDIEPCEVT